MSTYDFLSLTAHHLLQVVFYDAKRLAQLEERRLEMLRLWELAKEQIDKTLIDITLIASAPASSDRNDRMATLCERLRSEYMTQLLAFENFERVNRDVWHERMSKR